jgi:ribulose-5-phosphate 4-epimerase/fuculose-1-phosphate aldolase
MIGDREEEDINGAILNNLFAFHFNKNNKFNIKEKCIEFGNYKTIKDFFQIYVDSLKRVIYYSQRIGERLDLTQGAGGNISVKFEFENYKFLVIKSSGYLLSNINMFEGVTLLYLQNDKYVKLWGNNPSIETIVHTTLSLNLVIHCHPTVSIIKGLTNFDIEYTEPGIELANILINYKTKEYIVLQNHGIIYQTNDINILLDNFEYKIYDHLNSKYKVCNQISDKVGGITTLFEHSKDFISQLNRFGECILNMSFTPDYALFCNKIIKLKDMNNIHKDNLTIIYLYNDILYCNASTLYKCKQLDEMLIQYISILESINDINNVKCLTQYEIYNIKTREDEKHRLNR